MGDSGLPLSFFCIAGQLSALRHGEDAPSATIRGTSSPWRELLPHHSPKIALLSGKWEKIFMLLAAVLLSGVSVFAQSNEQLKADVNEDGVVDFADVVAVIDIIQQGRQANSTIYYWYVGNSMPSTVDTSNLKSSAAEIGWHIMDDTAISFTVGQCVVENQSTWYVCIPVINGSAFTKVLSGGIDVTTTYRVTTETIDGQEYTIFEQKQATKKLKCVFSK